MSKAVNNKTESLESLDYYYIPDAGKSVKAKNINDAISKVKEEK